MQRHVREASRGIVLQFIQGTKLSQTQQPFFIFKIHLRQHVSALQSHHQALLINRSKINIYSAVRIPSVYINGTVRIIVLLSDMGIYIHCRMCLKVKNTVYL